MATSKSTADKSSAAKKPVAARTDAKKLDGAKPKYDKAQRIDNRATVLALGLKSPTPLAPGASNKEIHFTLSGKTKIAPD